MKLSYDARLWGECSWPLSLIARLGEEPLSADEPDWRLSNGGDHLKGLALARRVWRETRPQWDHDHCELCMAKIADARIPEALHEAYATKDEYRWICEVCFGDFREFYGWRLTDA
jgi:hypothetical protein